MKAVASKTSVSLPIAYVRELIDATTDARSLLDAGLDVSVIKTLDKRLERLERYEDKLSDEVRATVDMWNDK